MRRGVMIATIAALAVLIACNKDKPAANGSGFTAAGSGSGAATTAGSGSGAGTVAAAGSAARTPSGGSAALPSTIPARPASVTDDQVKIAEAFVAANDKLAHDVAAAGTDCKKAAAAVTANATAFGAAAEAASGLRTAVQNDPDAKQWFQMTYVPKMMAAQGVMSSTAQACAGDVDFKAALTSVPMGPRKLPARPAVPAPPPTPATP